MNTHSQAPAPARSAKAAGTSQVVALATLLATMPHGADATIVSVDEATYGKINCSGELKAAQNAQAGSDKPHYYRLAGHCELEADILFHEKKPGSERNWGATHPERATLMFNAAEGWWYPKTRRATFEGYVDGSDPGGRFGRALIPGGYGSYRIISLHYQCPVNPFTHPGTACRPEADFDRSKQHVDKHQSQFGKLHKSWDFCSPGVRAMCPPFAGRVDANQAATLSAQHASKLAAEEADTLAKAKEKTQLKPIAVDGATATAVQPAGARPVVVREARPTAPNPATAKAIAAMEAAGCSAVPGKAGHYICNNEDALKRCERLRQGGEVQGCQSRGQLPTRR